MGILSQAKSIHIVRQYREPVVRTDMQGGGVLVGMFLEYCPNGDLLRFMGPGAKMMEVDLWAMFVCLALGGAAVDRGTEDMDSQPVLFGTLEETLVHYE